MSAFPEAQYVIEELTDVIESQGSGGSLITVRTEDSEFYGETITLSDGHTSMTATMSNQGVAQFYGVTMSGELTVSATVSGQTYSTTVNVTYYGSYNVELAVATGIYGVIWDGSSSQAWTRTDDAVDFAVGPSEVVFVGFAAHAVRRRFVRQMAGHAQYVADGHHFFGGQPADG